MCGCDYFGETIGNASIFWEYMSPTPSCYVNVYQHMTMSKIMKDAVKPETVIIGAGMSVLGDGMHNELRGLEAEKTSFENMAELVLNTGGMDMIGLGRQALADPYMPIKMRNGRDDEISWCLTCNLCSELEVRQEHIGCVVYNQYYAGLLKECRKKFGKLNRIVTGD